METIFSIIVGLFFAASIYLMLSPQLVRILLGVSIFGNAVNLMIFTAGRLTEAVPPVLSAAGDHAPQPPVTPTSPAPDAIADQAAAAGDAAVHAAHTAGDAAGAVASAISQSNADMLATANPLPQALILTAIVISFSIFAFLLVLTFRAYQSLDTDSVDSMRLAEPTPRVPPLGY
ncbi:Na+/H+ antiporter subunit C [Acuticoccus mangrovi]|uniref:NADH-quinone oxidoreductase subunit K n=1 Tax=Acuticoccus mangrovi TaxID=2796142 RepID=A0A934IKU8_9HYPH|nr:Na+/H+ antiporter subunit C [Acuticoccus mangrovi]MBJ3774485.1 NADH-quinone oxidoreductase subunit K [Acuticoccus mangrovi]